MIFGDLGLGMLYSFSIAAFAFVIGVAVGRLTKDGYKPKRLKKSFMEQRYDNNNGGTEE